MRHCRDWPVWPVFPAEIEGNACDVRAFAAEAIKGMESMDEKTRPPRVTDPSQVAEDTRIAEEVARTLAASGRFASGRVEVLTSEGIVTLRGWVGGYYQKQVAQVAASTVIGPCRLVNEIEVG